MPTPQRILGIPATRRGVFSDADIASAKPIAPVNALKHVLAFVALLLVFSLVPAQATDYKREVIDPSYQHDKYGTLPRDIVREFRAYIVSFDSKDDDDGDRKPDIRGIPEWVSYEMREYPRKLRRGPARPSTWITDSELYEAGIAPSDATYAYPSAFRKAHKNWYARGHLCMKEHAWRLGAAADWNTHTVLNAVPQREYFNSGIWLDLEKKTAAWADKYGAVWIIAGPVFKNKKPSRWLGEEGDLKIAIPDALFKIVIRESDDPQRPHVLAFLYPQECEDCTSPKGPFDHRQYLTSVKNIEARTGLNFFTTLPAADQRAIESDAAKTLWQ
ncbi:MAG: DNA/RNA non-specific endonuclease [Nitrospira sp.]|nr:DNA/RNA non-specific endonuclease [Nitrospira sp.]